MAQFNALEEWLRKHCLRDTGLVVKKNLFKLTKCKTVSPSCQTSANICQDIQRERIEEEKEEGRKKGKKDGRKKCCPHATD